MHRPLRPRSLGSRPQPRVSSKSLPSFQTAANAVLKQLQLLDILPDCLLLGMRRARAVYHRDFFEVTWCRVSPNSRGIPGKFVYGVRSQSRGNDEVYSEYGVKVTAFVFYERSTELERTVQTLCGARSTEWKVPGVAYSRGPGVGSTPGYSVLFLTLGSSSAPQRKITGEGSSSSIKAKAGGRTSSKQSKRSDQSLTRTCQRCGSRARHDPHACNARPSRAVAADSNKPTFVINNSDGHLVKRSDGKTRICTSYNGNGCTFAFCSHAHICSLCGNATCNSSAADLLQTKRRRAQLLNPDGWESAESGHTSTFHRISPAIGFNGSY
ncbi:hypothetical protein V8E36_006061 [Tilletia maclaganii]